MNQYVNYSTQEFWKADRLNIIEGFINSPSKGCISTQLNKKPQAINRTLRYTRNLIEAENNAQLVLLAYRSGVLSNQSILSIEKSAQKVKLELNNCWNGYNISIPNAMALGVTIQSLAIQKNVAVSTLYNTASYTKSKIGLNSYELFVLIAYLKNVLSTAAYNKIEFLHQKIAS
ncbi:MAG: hypothetical protein RIC95_09495 [Vicingaceae bacterium]